MNKLFETVSFATVLIILALILISISLLFTGRQRIKSGTCGRFPKKGKENEICENKGGCDLCDPIQKKENTLKKEANEDEDADRDL